MNWRDFWNRENPIYVNERHRGLHYDRIARGIADLVDAPDWSVLDHGSGEALSSDLVARRCGLLYLFDAAPNVQGKQRIRFENNPKIIVLSNDSLDAIPDGSLDMVVANSLLQYLTHGECETLLDFWRGKLKPRGKLVLADILPAEPNALADIGALLHFGWQGGFFFAACAGLVSTWFSDYRQLRTSLGLTGYAESDLRVLLSAHGFEATRAPKNLGHNQNRMMIVARVKG
jgi:ubiquinone/menaquinone biosynthesis C-methylase UbiE